MAKPPSRKRSWREAAAGPGSRPVDKAWHRDRRPVQQEAPWWKTRKARIGFVTAAVLLVTGMIVVIVLLFQPVPPLRLVVIAPDYKTIGSEANLFVPHNVSGRNGVDQLTSLGVDWGDKKRPDVKDVLAPKDIEDALAVPLWGKAPKTVVVFVSAHGVARHKDGRLVAYLVPQDNDLKNGAPLYRLKDLLDELAKLPPKTQKLLLLDVTQVSAHWPLGELHNDFASALDSLEDEIRNIKNLVVISSSAKYQRSWVSPEWGQTCFAHFVLEGLKGQADARGRGNDNGRVDALELFNYVSREVERWALHNRDRAQTPVMFPGDDDKRAKEMELVRNEMSKRNEQGDDKPDGNQEGNDVAQKKQEDDYKELRDAWKNCQELRKGSPHPAVYAPHLWRRYLDMLLRAEQLQRAGDVVASRKLLGDAEQLHKRIEDAKSLELDSAKLTLAMPAALGLPVKDEQERLDAIDRSWKQPDAKLDEVFKECEKDPPLLRAAHAGQVTRSVAAKPEELLGSGRLFLEKLDALLADRRPVEVHYLMMLRPEIDAKKSSPIDPLLERKRWDLVQKSLQVRLLAEQAALGLSEEEADQHLPAYSEQVLPWIKKLVEGADTDRRRGEDLLFTSNSKEWDGAKDLLEGAHKKYQEAQQLAVEIRRALETRDRCFVELPYYTHWVANSGPEHEPFTINLWTNLHKLDHQLGQPAADEKAIAQQVEELKKLSDGITADFEALENWVKASLLKEENISQARWHEIEAALVVPFLETNARIRRIKDSRDISRKLFDEAPKDPGAKAPGGDRENQARQQALRQGRLALAALGDDWPESANIKKDLDDPPLESWRNALARAGEKVGQLLNRLPEEADDQCKTAENADLKKADQELQSAARNARTIDGATVGMRMARDPIGDKRRLDWHRLLCWQADRTYLDWWAELPGRKAPHYYQKAAKIFLDDAETLVSGEAANAKVKNKRERLSKPELVVNIGLSEAGDFSARPEPLHLTDQPKDQGLLRYYRLSGPSSEEVPGAPVMWADEEAQRRGQPSLIISDEERERKAVSIGAPYRYKIAAGERKDDTTLHVVHGFFRGHHSKVASNVRTYLRPDVTFSIPLKHGGGSVAVQTTKDLYDLLGPENTAISIVLDCSGSMKDAYTLDAKNPNTRFQKATQALERVVEDLPPGVTLSFLAFGAERFDPTGTLAEKDHIKLLLGPEKLNDKLRRDFKREIASLKPYYFTPLLRSIRMASEAFPKDPNLAARTVLVVTDGGDSTFYGEKDEDSDLKEKSGQKTVTGYLEYLKKEFDKSGIQLVVIGFNIQPYRLNSLGERKAYDEFKTAKEKIGFVYKDVQQVAELTATLEDSLLRSYFRVDPRFASTPVAVGDLSRPITRSSAPPAWVPLPPDSYQVRVPSIRKLREQDIRLDSGDVLLFDLVKLRNEESPRPTFRQSMYAKSENLVRNHGPEHIHSADPQGGWLLSVLQNQQPEGRDWLQILATLQKDQGDPTRREIKQARPEWCWFEIPAARGGRGSPHLSISPVSNYPAPAWSLDLPYWKRGAPVKLNAWWGDLPLNKPHGILRGRPPQFNQDLRIEEPTGSIRLESLTYEKASITVEEGRPGDDMECLVVRLSYPPEQGPFFVRWPAPDIGQEHHFYMEAGKYTGLFWTTRGSIKDRVLESLELYSIKELKQKGFHPGELHVGEPNDLWERPRPAPVGKYALPD